MNTQGIWKRTGTSDISREAYVRAIAFFTLIVGGILAVGAVGTYSWTFSWPLLIGTFVAAIIGIVIFQRSGNPTVSFLGVCLMSISMGMMIGPLVALYEVAVVMQALVLTVVIMGVMSVIGIVIPKTFEGWGPYLMGGLVLLIIAQFGQLIFMSLGFAQAGDMPLLAWAGVALFTAFIAYDWSRALALPYTWDNAIDASGGLILDAVNIFIRLLQILNGSSGSKR